MKNLYTPIALLFMLVLLPAAAPAQTPEQTAGREKAQTCTVCHGPLGVSNLPDTPHIAGQPAIYIAAQLRAYRSGARKHEVMSLMAKPLTDEHISQLAAWFSAIRIDAQAPN